MKVQAIILSIFFSFPLFGQDQFLLTTRHYAVDSQINFRLKSFHWIDSGVLRQSMSIKVLQDRRIFFNQSLDCYTKSYIRNDTIFITGHIVGGLGWGFALLLFRDSCIVTAFALSDGEIYKFRDSDTSYTSLITLPNKAEKVILARTPLYKEEEIVTGFVEIKSDSFYYKGFKEKFTIDLHAYFKTAPLKRIE